MGRYKYNEIYNKYMQSPVLGPDKRYAPSSALKQDSKRRWKSFDKFKKVIIGAGIIWGLYFGYNHMNTYAPIWEASVYKLDERARPHKVWKKSGTEEITAHIDLLPWILNRDNKRLLEQFKDVRVMFHSEDHPNYFAGYHDPDKRILHIYPGAKSATILHESLHFIYKNALTNEDREEFNKYVWKIYELANRGEAERMNALGRKYTPGVKAYLDAVRKIIERGGIPDESAEYRWYIQTELFAAIADYPEYKIAAPVSKIYAKYLDEEVVRGLANPATTDMF